MRVLLAEEGINTPLERALEDCRVDRVPDLESATSALADGEYDVVVLNLGIPPLVELPVPVFWVGERLAPETGEIPPGAVQPGLLLPVLQLALERQALLDRGGEFGSELAPKKRTGRRTKEKLVDVRPDSRLQTAHGQHWENILLASPVALLCVDPAGFIQFANEAAAELFDQSRDKLVGRALGRMLLKDQVDVLLKNLWAWVQEDSPEGHTCELRIHIKKGLRTLRASGRRTGDPQHLTVQLALVDISQQVELQESLDLWQAVMGAALSAVDFGVLVADQAGTITSANPAAARMLGYKAAELSGCRLRQFFPRMKLDTLELQVLPGRGADRAFPAELRVGSTKVGGRLKLIVQVTDISRSRRAQSEIHEVRERERWRVGQDLHDDVGQHMAALSFVAGVLESRLAGADPEVKKLAAQVNEQCRQAIGRIRALARSLYPTDLERRGLPAALQELASNTADSYGVQCRSFVPIISLTKPLSLHLYRIAQEAVSNAVRHGHPNLIDILLANEGDQVTLTVTDDGVGIPPQIESQGMGLRSMRHHAELIQGNLQIDSVPGKGTVVRCEAPRGGTSLTPPAPAGRPAPLLRRGPAR